MRHTQKQDTILFTLRHECDDMSNDETRKGYVRGVLSFCEFARAQGINYVTKLPDTREGRIDLVQRFADKLVADGKRPDTVHTYLTGVCHAIGNVTHDHISLREIDKPRRGNSTKGRNPSRNRQGRMEAVKPDNSRLMEFAGAVGFRRAEYRKLDGRSYFPDESGYMCVWVVGKLGKLQAQRILPESVPIVEDAFSAVRGKQRVFSRDELENKIDLHGVRRQVAQRAYEYYHHRLQTEPGYRDQLRGELIARFDALYPSGRENAETTREQFIKNLYGFSGVYVCRSEVAKTLRAQGKDTVYDRLALMATSTFHLSHWRPGIAVRRYMM